MDEDDNGKFSLGMVKSLSYWELNVCSNINICKCLVSNQTKMSNFHQLEVGGRGGETQIQVYANLSYLDSDSDLFIRHYNKTEFNM